MGHTKRNCGRFVPCLDQFEDRVTPATKYWEGDVSYDWMDPDNWLGGSIPLSTDSVRLDMASGGETPKIKLLDDVTIVDLSGNEVGLEVAGTLNVAGLSWHTEVDLFGSGTINIRGLSSIDNGSVDVNKITIQQNGNLTLDSDEEDMTPFEEFHVAEVNVENGGKLTFSTVVELAAGTVISNGAGGKVDFADGETTGGSLLLSPAWITL